MISQEIVKGAGNDWEDEPVNSSYLGVFNTDDPIQAEVGLGAGCRLGRKTMIFQAGTEEVFRMVCI